MEVAEYSPSHDCSECKGEGPFILFGNVGDFKSDTAWICFKCLAKASALMKEHLSGKYDKIKNKDTQ